MSEYGFKAIGDTGILQIDGTNRNFHFYEKIRVSAGFERRFTKPGFNTYYTTRDIAIPLNAIVVVNALHNVCITYVNKTTIRVYANNNSIPMKGPSNEPVANRVDIDIYIYTLDGKEIFPSDYGLKVFNGVGAEVYSSTKSPLKILETGTTSRSGSTAPNTNIINDVVFSKVYTNKVVAMTAISYYEGATIVALDINNQSIIERGFGAFFTKSSTNPPRAGTLETNVDYMNWPQHGVIELVNLMEGMDVMLVDVTDVASLPYDRTIT